MTPLPGVIPKSVFMNRIVAVALLMLLLTGASQAEQVTLRLGGDAFAVAPPSC